jgi:type IV pilus assembly protein PilW
MMISINTSQKGFTLIELMVGMAIASVLMAAIFTFYRGQLKSHITQQERVNMQQDARVGMYMMTREIRMAGYDPQNTGDFTILIANADTIFFQSDMDGDGTPASDEHFLYSLNGDNLARSNVLPPSPSPVALNIDDLNFVYLDGAGTVLDDDGNGNVLANMAAIRSVQITLVARTAERGLMYREKDSIRLTAAVKVRNLGL